MTTERIVINESIFQMLLRGLQTGRSGGHKVGRGDLHYWFQVLSDAILLHWWKGRKLLN